MFSSGVIALMRLSLLVVMGDIEDGYVTREGAAVGYGFAAGGPSAGDPVP